MTKTEEPLFIGSIVSIFCLFACCVRTELQNSSSGEEQCARLTQWRLHLLFRQEKKKKTWSNDSVPSYLFFMRAVKKKDTE